MENTMSASMNENSRQQQHAIDEQYMRRCLQLARNGWQNAKPNPMVGAVIVSAGQRIIGEGYHVRCGEGHAEVNAFASVRPEDEALLKESTVYVSLEPCSHWGKTPPCADLIVSKGVRRVVCGCIDPFSEVQGRGVERIRQAGIEVTVGVLEQECLELNQKFITFNTEKRPYILLKWAQTINGKISQRLASTLSSGMKEHGMDESSQPPRSRMESGGGRLLLSSPFTKMLVHKLRAETDAILVGHETMYADHPRLNTRDWSGHDPERLVLAHDAKDVPQEFRHFDDIDTLLRYLYENHRQSLVVEGGALTLRSFLKRGLWDEIRVETAPMSVVEGTDAPDLPGDVELVETRVYDGNVIRRYKRLSKK
ncbi:MAG: bifunctional diaminohydroxyphosphoribosylaminopyrimidine deaminase/5-amino-6-(5-phosphoribosylamino)uracil reductase RibD [Prevotella sp.]